MTYYVDKIIKAAQGADDFLVAAHDDPDSTADALVDKLEREDLRYGIGRGGIRRHGRY